MAGTITFNFNEKGKRNLVVMCLVGIKQVKYFKLNCSDLLIAYTNLLVYTSAHTFKLIALHTKN